MFSWLKAEPKGKAGKSPDVSGSAPEGHQPVTINFSDQPGVVSYDQDFPYFDWKAVHTHISRETPKENWGGFYNEAARQWLKLLQPAMGSGFVAEESKQFFLLSNRDDAGRKSFLKNAEEAWRTIQKNLAGLKTAETFGKRMVLLFDQQETYYRYISHYYQEGDYATSGGMFITRGYGHIAIPTEGQKYLLPILAHELSHNALFTLPLPRWLDEGLAEQFACMISGQSYTNYDMDLIEEHRGHWNGETIQLFWEGVAFKSPDHAKLNYSLARILLNLLKQEKGDFKSFLQHAHYADGGQEAATKFMDQTLGQIAGIFLGPGDWEPRPPETKVSAAPPPV